MFFQLFGVKSYATRITSGTPVVQVRASRWNSGGVLAGMYHVLTVMGVSAMCVLAVMFVKPDFADKLISLSPFVAKATDEQNAELAKLAALVEAPAATEATAAAKPAEQEAKTEEPKRSLGNESQQRWVTHWLAKRYRVANDAANMLVSAAYTTAVETKLDPLLILAVIAVESRFNPFAESPMGAQGLMQVMSKVHKEKFDDHGGVRAALNPVANIKVGSQILKEYVDRSGSIEGGLKSYVGAALHDTDYGYGAKVMGEYHRLKQVASGKKVPTTATMTASVTPKKSRASAKAEQQAEAKPLEPAPQPKLASSEERSAQL
ncbi:MAG: lytic transglycosylase domain-containing protein [Burkholderiaceae bacterium]|nr:lytic transglycosylase domain-containing protein [Burkholderiaceae bacterium]